MGESKSTGLSDDRLSKLGEGGAQARKLLDDIERSKVPERVKREARERYENGGKNKSKGVLGSITSGLGNVVEGALSAVDKPKRAVIAGIEEAAEAIGYLDEDDKSFTDNVLRERTYGGGDLLRRSIEENPDSTDAALFDGKWQGRLAGLALDIGLDPLTYLTAGATVAAKGGKGAAGVAGLGRGAARASGKEAGRRLAAAAAGSADDVAIRQAAEAVLRANSAFAASADELAEAGLQGGVRLAGQTIIPHDLARALGGKGVAAGKTKLAGTRAAAGARNIFGGSGELRTALRAGDDPLRALGQMDSARAARLTTARFTAQQAGEMVDTVRSLKKAKIDGKDVTRALQAGPDSALFRTLNAKSGGAVERARVWQASVRAQANDIAGFDYIAERENFVHRMLNDEAREHFAKVANGKARARPFKPGDFEKGAVKPGQEWMGVRITDDVPVEKQMQDIANARFGDDAKQLFEEDFYKIAPHYLKGVGRSVEDKATLQGLRERGVITDTPVNESGLDELTEAVRGMRAAGEPDGLRAQATEVRARMAGSNDPTEIGLLRAEADQLDLDAELAVLAGRANAAVDVVERELRPGGRLRAPETQAAIRELIEQELAQQFKLFNLTPGQSTTQKLGGQLGEQIDSELLDEMVKARELVTTDYGKLLKSLDAANRGFKTYALLTPGFHVRNMFGGVFNNAVANVNPENYLRFARARRAHERVLQGKLAESAVRDGEGYRAYVELYESGLLDDGARITDATDLSSPRNLKDVARKRTTNRVLTDTRLTRLSRLGGQQTEDMLRGTLAFDRLLKGTTLDGAIDDVHHFHFDYHDLSKFEQGVARRIIPFYTWTSRNLGRQAEFFLSNPKAYSRFNSIKTAIGDPETGPNATPDYLQGPGTIRWAGGDALTLPAAVPVLGGKPLVSEGMTLTPGLPFEAADESLRQLNNPAAFLLQDSTPFIKAPIEATFNTQFFSELPLNQRRTEAPETWKKIPGFMRALEAAGIADRGEENGTWLISGENGYLLEQHLPLLGRIRRMFPSEEKYQDRATTTWLSFIGLGTRTIDETTQEGEMYRRADELRKIRDRRREEGYEIGKIQKKKR